MIIRFPNEQLPPSLMRFALWLLSCVFGLLGLALLVVGVWATSAQDGSGRALMIVGAGFLLVGSMVALGLYLKRKLTN